MKKMNEIYLASLLLFGFLATLLFLNTKTFPKTINYSSGKVREYNFGKGEEDLEINEDKRLEPGEYEYKSVHFKNGKLTLKETIKPKGLVIRAKEKIVVENEFVIDISGRGEKGNMFSIGSPEINNEFAGDGGSISGSGGIGDCRIQKQNQIFTINDEPEVFGSGGGVSLSDKQGIGGSGGGYILLTAPEIIINGDIISNGEDGIITGGGGSGGKISLVGNKLEINGELSANGGIGGSGMIQGAGGGNGGVIFLAGQLINKGKIEVNGGAGGKATDIYSGCNGGNGENGKIFAIK